MTDPNENLANAIILQAVKDYRHALKLLGRNSKCTSAIFTRDECERFFRSEWFKFLTTVDGEMLIRKLKAEVN